MKLAWRVRFLALCLASVGGFAASAQTDGVTLKSILSRMAAGQLIEDERASPSSITDDEWPARLAQLMVLTGGDGKEVGTVGYYLPSDPGRVQVLPTVNGNDTSVDAAAMLDAVRKVPPAGTAIPVVVAHTHPKAVTFSQFDALKSISTKVVLFEVNAEFAEMLIPTRFSTLDAQLLLLFLPSSSWSDSLYCRMSGLESFQQKSDYFDKRFGDVMAAAGLVRYFLAKDNRTWKKFPQGNGQETQAFLTSFKTTLGDAIRMSAVGLDPDEVERQLADGRFAADVRTHLGLSFGRFIGWMIPKVRPGSLDGEGHFNDYYVTGATVSGACDGSYIFVVKTKSGEKHRYRIWADGEVINSRLET